MKSWQFTTTGEPLALADVPEPSPGPGEVVIQVRAAGLCHTDVGVLTDPGWMSTLVRTPITPGHEVAGTVLALGEGVTGWSIGDRVGLCPTTPAGAPGFSTDGGFGEQIVIDAQALVAIPDNVSFALGAAGTDAGMTSYHAVITNGQVHAGSKVGIIGAGGLGEIGIRAAVLAGATVYVADISAAARERATHQGATAVGESIREFGDVGLDVVVDFAGFGTTTAEAIETVGLGGRVVQVGMGKLEATISTKALILSQVTLIGSNGGTKEDVAGVYEYFATGQLEPSITEISFEEIPAGLQRLHDGQVDGRLVAVY